MAVFISYSHQDVDFVDQLAGHLIQANTNVWIDRWELNVGDSLVRRIEKAIEHATAIIFVLSKASVASEWCRKELTAGLVRELEEKKVLVLPVMLEDCDIPLFLREKKYADFRVDFDKGLREVREALAKVTSLTLGRVDEPEWHIDFSTNWGINSEGNVLMEVLLVEHAEEQPYSAVSFVNIALNDIASARHLELVECGAETFARQLVLESLIEVPDLDQFHVILEDAEVVRNEFGIRDQKAGLEFHVLTKCRRVGEDTGRDILLRIGKQIKKVIMQTRSRIRPLSKEEHENALAILKKYREDLP